MLQKVRNDEQGFTLIELLVVILIIGILAAIALPSFLGQQKKGQDASTKSDVRNAVSQVESCFVDEQDYANCKTPEGLPSGVTVTAPDGLNKYSATATSKSGNTFTISKVAADGSYKRTCTSNANGGCKSDGTW